MVTLIHGADFHLDSPFSGLSPDRAVQRRQEQRLLPQRLAALCRERGADVVLLAGDLLDGEGTFSETRRALADALGQVPAPVFIAPGNHDYWSDRSPYARQDWPENVHIFRGGWERVALPRLGCVVYGAGFTAPRQETSLLEGFRPEEDGDLVRLMVLHGEADAARGQYNPLAPGQLADSGMDYVALGHVHAFGGVLRAGRTAWAYSGCPEGRGFDETGDKGVLWGTVERGAARMELVPLCTRRYLAVTADLSGGADPAGAVERALAPARPEDICRVVLTGERGAGRLDTAGLLALVESRCWQGQLWDQTVLARDLWARREEDSLTGLFLREMAARLARCEDGGERAVLEQAARFGLAALEGGEDQ